MDYSERNRQILIEFLNGKSTFVIGEEFGITKARVRNIVIQTARKYRFKIHGLNDLINRKSEVLQKALTIKLPPNNALTTTKISKLTGLKTGTIHLYVDTGIVIPDISIGSGTGTSRYYSSVNLKEFVLVERLMRILCIPKRKIKDVLQHMRDNGLREKMSFKYPIGVHFLDDGTIFDVSVTPRGYRHKAFPGGVSIWVTLRESYV